MTNKCRVVAGAGWVAGPACCRATEPRRGGGRARGGFTLVEIMIVVSVVGVVSSMAVPCFRSSRRSSRVAAFVQTARVIGQAAELYAMDHGTFPPESPVGTAPEALRRYLKSTSWEEPTPLGGLWDWDLNCPGAGAALTVKGNGLSLDAMEEVDRRLDDGDLATGSFRMLGSNTVAYIVQGL